MCYHHEQGAFQNLSWRDTLGAFDNANSIVNSGGTHENRDGLCHLWKLMWSKLRYLGTFAITQAGERTLHESRILVTKILLQEEISGLKSTF